MMKKGFYVEDGGQRLFIQGDRQLLILYPNEIIQAVLLDEDLYIKANKRGKSEIRIQQNEARQTKLDAQYAEQFDLEPKCDAD